MDKMKEEYVMSLIKNLNAEQFEYFNAYIENALRKQTVSSDKCTHPKFGVSK